MFSLHTRADAYRALFLVRSERGRDPRGKPWWAFWRRRRGGQVGPAADIVLRDLASYCYAARSTLKVSQADQHVDPLAMAFAEGRRDVFNRICGHLNLTSDQLARLTHERSADE